MRHGRMLVSPFAYFRGAALAMAADLAGTRSSELRVQLCGDAHLLNFGAFASPERRLVFDLNDFDETLPGPFEWDVKRLVASMAVAGRDNGLTTEQRRKVALSAAAAYRTAMREFATMSILNVWYAHFDVQDALARLESELPKKAVRMTKAQVAKARTRDSTQALAKLTTVKDGRRRIISDPPLIVPVEELASDLDVDAVYRFLRGLFTEYTQTLPAYRRRLAERFTLTSVARKVVGVGSVGPNIATQSDCPVWTPFPGAAVAGPYHQVLGEGCVYPAAVPTLGNQLSAAGRSWAAYLQDMGNDPVRDHTVATARGPACGHPATWAVDHTQNAEQGDQYAARHDGFTFFTSVTANQDFCAAHILSFRPLPSDLAQASTTPAFSFIAPDLCDDGHDSPCVTGAPGGLAKADAFLARWVPTIMAAS